MALGIPGGKNHAAEGIFSHDRHEGSAMDQDPQCPVLPTCPWFGDVVEPSPGYYRGVPGCQPAVLSKPGHLCGKPWDLRGITPAEVVEKNNRGRNPPREGWFFFDSVVSGPPGAPASPDFTAGIPPCTPKGPGRPRMAVPVYRGCRNRTLQAANDHPVRGENSGRDDEKPVR